MMDALTELLSDFWYAVTHSIGYALVTNEFILWIMAAFLALWVAGIVYNERRHSNQSPPKQANH